MNQTHSSSALEVPQDHQGEQLRLYLVLIPIIIQLNQQECIH